jgi:hypothetical protein
VDADTMLRVVTDDRPDAFFQLLKKRAHELCPDYPFSEKDDAFTWLWALTSSLEGVGLACDDWCENWKRLVEAVKGLLAANELMMGEWFNVQRRDAVRSQMSVVETALKWQRSD